VRRRCGVQGSLVRGGVAWGEPNPQKEIRKRTRPRILKAMKTRSGGEAFLREGFNSTCHLNNGKDGLCREVTLGKYIDNDKKENEKGARK